MLFELVFVCFMGPFWCVDHECSHDASVVAALVDHVVGFGIFVEFQVSSLDQDVDLFLGSSKRSLSRLFPERLSVCHVDSCEIL